MQEERINVGFDPEGFAEKIAEAMGRSEESAKIEAELMEVVTTAKEVLPIVERYGPALIKECGPAFRAVTKAMIEETLPVTLPTQKIVIRAIAKEVFQEFFSQLMPMVQDMERQSHEQREQFEARMREKYGD